MNVNVTYHSLMIPTTLLSNVIIEKSFSFQAALLCMLPKSGVDEICSPTLRLLGDSCGD